LKDVLVRGQKPPGRRRSTEISDKEKSPAGSVAIVAIGQADE